MEEGGGEAGWSRRGEGVCCWFVFGGWRGSEFLSPVLSFFIGFCLIGDGSQCLNGNRVSSSVSDSG